MSRIKLFASLLLSGLGLSSFAAGISYHIRLKMPDANDTMVYLLHYYGKPRPNVFKIDSARFDKNMVADFKSSDPEFVGGIYIMLLSNRKADFEFLLNKGDDMSITANVSKLPEGITFKNSAENERFQKYVSYLKDYAEVQKGFEERLKKAHSTKDTEAVRKDAIAYNKKLIAYRRDYAKNYPGTLLTKIFDAMEVPEIPEGPHYLEDGVTKDSTFNYRYYKSHFWDGFDFHDDRLIYTPLYDSRLEEYFNKLVVPATDSVEKECDFLLKKAKGSKDVFHYTLWWVTKFAETSKIMGMDEVFVYLVENYYMKGDAFWLKPDELAKYTDRAQKIAPNVIGNLAPEIKLPNVITKRDESMLAMKAKYTLIVFYSPNCGHCQHEMPKLDSLYQAVLKGKGVKVYTVATEGEEKAITDFIHKNNMDEWTNTWDHDHVGDYHNKFDVYSTPTIYLLDEKKIIKGKRLDHSNIAGLIDMIEKHNKDKAKEKGSKTHE